MPLKPRDGGGERSKRGGSAEASRGRRVRVCRRPWIEGRRRIDERRHAVGSGFACDLADFLSSGSRQILEVGRVSAEDLVSGARLRARPAEVLVVSDLRETHGGGRGEIKMHSGRLPARDRDGRSGEMESAGAVMAEWSGQMVAGSVVRSRQARP